VLRFEVSGSGLFSLITINTVTESMVNLEGTPYFWKGFTAKILSERIYKVEFAALILQPDQRTFVL